MKTDLGNYGKPIQNTISIQIVLPISLFQWSHVSCIKMLISTMLQYSRNMRIFVSANQYAMLNKVYEMYTFSSYSSTGKLPFQLQIRLNYILFAQLVITTLHGHL